MMMALPLVYQVEEYGWIGTNRIVPLYRRENRYRLSRYILIGWGRCVLVCWSANLLAPEIYHHDPSRHHLGWPSFGVKMSKFQYAPVSDSQFTFIYKLMQS